MRCGIKHITILTHQKLNKVYNKGVVLRPVSEHQYLPSKYPFLSGVPLSPDEKIMTAYDS